MKTTKTLRLHTRMLRENRNRHGATDARSVQARASKEHVPCAEAVNHAAACGTRAESARQRLGQKHHALGANALNAASKADALLHPPPSRATHALRGRSEDAGAARPVLGSLASGRSLVEGADHGLVSADVRAWNRRTLVVHRRTLLACERGRGARLARLLAGHAW